MASERLQRQIDRLLIENEEAIPQLNWTSYRDCARAVLAIYPANSEGLSFLALAPQLHSTSVTSPTAVPQLLPLSHPTARANHLFRCAGYGL